MRNTLNKRIAGFSLLEMVIYIAILSLSAVLMVNLMLSFANSFNSLRVSRSINNAATVALERMVREIKNADEVVTTDSTFDIHPGNLTLITNKQGATTTTEFYLEGNIVHVREGGIAVCYAKLFVGESPAAYCPFGPSIDRQIVVFGTGDIRSDSSYSQAYKGPFSFSLLPGNYQVTLSSFDEHGSGHSSQPNEQWHVLLEESDDTVIATSDTISDLPDNDSFLTEVVNSNLPVPQEIEQVRPLHSSYPDGSSPNSIHPFCASFDKLSESETLNNAICHLSVTPNEINPGESATLSWTSQNSLFGTIDQGIGAVSPVSGGSVEVSPLATTQYTGTFGFNGFNTGALMRKDVQVTDLVFYFIESNRSQSVRIEMTVTGTRGKVTKTKTFYATAVLRGSYR